MGAYYRETNQIIAKVVAPTGKEILHEFIDENTRPDVVIYPDEVLCDHGLYRK